MNKINKTLRQAYSRLRADALKIYAALCQSYSNSRAFRILYVSIPLFLLACFTIVATIIPSYFFSSIQDAILYPYLFQGAGSHDIIVPTNHANILKFPLFLLQAALPYNFTALMIVQILLVVLTVLGSALIFIHLFGKKYTPVICLVLISILGVSVAFNVNVAETTIRNIEYPIGMLYIVYLSTYLKNKDWSKAQWVIGCLLLLLMAVTAAGDTLMLYAFCIPLLILAGFQLIQKRSYDEKSVVVGIATLLTIGLSVAIRHIASTFGIVDYFLSPQFTVTIAPVQNIAAGSVLFVDQLFRISGANIFGAQLSKQNSISFANAALLVVGVSGLIIIIKEKLANKRPVDPALFALSISFFLVSLAYIFGNQVVREIEPGHFVTANQERYISLLPILVVLGIIYLFTRVRHKSAVFILATIILAVFGAASLNHVYNSYLPYRLGADAKIANLKDVAMVLEQEKVPEVLTGDGIAAVLRFWSGDKVSIAPLANCTGWFQYNTRRSWQEPSPAVTKSALIVDQTGSDSVYWTGCTDEKITSIYGTPAKIIPVQNRLGPKPIAVWIYNTDIRSRVPQ